MFRAFSDPIRLRILNLIQSGELCVCDLVEVLELPQPTISRHLSYLRRARLVSVRQEQSWNFYRLSPARSTFHTKLLDCLGSCFKKMFLKWRATARERGRYGSAADAVRRDFFGGLIFAYANVFRRENEMMAILGDIHGNLPALETVLAHIRIHKIDAVYCLGDLVGYGPFPNETIERIRAERLPTLMGNYDDGVGFERDDCGCAYREAEEKRRGDQSLVWTKAQVTPENKAFLRTLPFEIRFETDGRRALLVHGSPRRINE